jgi:hypothetical protein
MVFLFGMIVAGLGLYLPWRSFRLRTTGVFTVGTVTGAMRIARHINLSVSFKTIKKNRIVTFNSRVNRWAYYWLQVGSSVPLFYDPHNPTRAAIDEPETMWWGPLIITALGCFIMVQGFTH